MLPFGCWITPKGRYFSSCCTWGSLYFRPRSRLKPYIVFFIFVTIWFFAATPRIRFFPLRATHDLKRWVLEHFIGISKHNTAGTIKHFKGYMQHCSTCICIMRLSFLNSQQWMLGTYATRWKKIIHIWVQLDSCMEENVTYLNTMLLNRSMVVLPFFFLQIPSEVVMQLIQSIPEVS